MELRPYQIHGKELVYDAFREGHKNVIYWLATGGGKSVAFTDMIIDAYGMDMDIVFCVRRRQLINQASGHLSKVKLPHGVYMAKHRKYKPSERIQICSIDTLASREIYPHEKSKRVLVIIDESHDCSPSSRKYSGFMSRYTHAHIIGFTATPFANNSFFTKIICPIQNYELREEGYLVPESTFVPNVIDVSSVKITRGGEFNERELFEASSRKEIVGDFVNNWRVYAQGRPTVLFAVNIEHSKIITEAFNAAGIKAVHCDAKTSTRERDHCIKQLVKGKIQILCNVNIFSTGVDIPPVSCIQICRPTQSLIWHLQAIGRGLRPSRETGKENCIIIDNAGNTIRHGTAYMPREAKLDDPKNKKVAIDEIKIRACKKCYFIMDSNVRQCPACSHVNPPLERKINHVDGELVQYEMTEEELELMTKRMVYADFNKLCYVAARNKKLDFRWVFIKLEEKYGVDKLSTYKDDLKIPKRLKGKL